MNTTTSCRYFVYFLLATCTHVHPFWSPESTQADVAPVIISPAGDAHTVGRTVGHEFERSLTAQFAQQLAASLESELGIPARITHSNCQSYSYLECANVSNCAHACLHLSIHFFQTDGPHSEMYVYYYSRATDFAQPCKGLAFVPIFQADILHKAKTQAWATKLATALRQATCSVSYVVHGPYGLALAPLLGVVAPALVVEIGLSAQAHWQDFVEPLVRAIEQLPLQKGGPT